MVDRGATEAGTQARVSVDQIVQAANGLACGEGLTALSMRRVAERLSVTAMSLGGAPQPSPMSATGDHRSLTV